MVSALNGWQGRRVFLTGHTGFKGAWLALLLKRLGASVHGYALEPVERGVYRAAAVDGAMDSSRIGDVRDLPALQAALRASEAELVIHMAAQPLVRASYVQPVETYAVNVMGTVHVLEAMRGLDHVKAGVVVTTDKCYENNEWLWGYRENEPMGGRDPYSNSKGCAELVTAAYRSSFLAESDVRVASGRAGNVIGGGDWSADRLVPDLVQTFLNGETTRIRSPHAVRPWQHVLDPVLGYVTLAARLLSDEGQGFAEGWNFGPDPSAERTVQDVVETAARHWGPSAQWQRDTGSHVHEATYLKLDSSKARQRLGWSPVWNFEAAMAETMAWYRAERDGADMKMKTLEQIDAYLGDLRGGEGDQT